MTILIKKYGHSVSLYLSIMIGFYYVLKELNGSAHILLRPFPACQRKLCISYMIYKIQG